ncbi:MAG: AsmA family protein [Terracidiphilus sp.]|jgi:hypothetical protein
MTEDAESWQRKRRRLWVALVLLAAILAVSIVPPLLSISRYKSRVAHLMSASLGRPVRLSSVELRLLPRPGFVLTNLTVEEDPAYGAEPLLHANTVVASIRLLSLWRGRLEIGSLSVDEASLNLVRTREGRWNLESFLRTAAAQAGAAEGSAGRPRAVPLPYLEATNSRINVKIGTEKLPFSLIATDLSFWQQEPGDWRIQLRGQPARTDLSLDLADTGVVRLQASARRAPDLRQMPVHLDLEWREAQLGQLARLMIGSDPGWRGDLTGELHLDGTADAAQVQTRLRASGVHRAEFAPPALVDFDARCAFVYHYSSRAFEHLACDSPFGDGRIHLAGELPGEGGQPLFPLRFSVQLDRLPVAVCLDALRAVRSGFAPNLEARGTISGKIAYSQSASEKIAPQSSAQEKPAGLANPGQAGSAKAHTASHGPFTGSFTVDGLQLSGDGLRTPIRVPKVMLEPVAASPGWQPGQLLSPALAATVAIPAGGTAPLAVTTRMALSGYQVTVRGQAALARARELARVAGMANAEALDALAGDPVAVDLSAEGPWLPPPGIPFSNIAPAVNEAAKPATDSLRGTVTLRNANWKADYLASHVLISTATLHLGNGETRWDPVVFSYGPVKGTASLSLPADCGATEPCPPRFQVQFGDLDAGVLQEAILGAREPGTLLSTLIDRLRFSSAPVWPRLEGTVKADSLILGPVTLLKPSAALRILPTGAEITGLDAGLLGGYVQAAGTLSTGDKPSYSLTGLFQKLSPAAVGQLLGLRWSGGVFNADGRIDLSGYTDKNLTASAKGALHFEWRHGSVGAPAASSAAAPVPAALARFDRWTADAEIANGAITLKQNQVQQGVRKRAVEAAVTLGDPPKVTFAAPIETHPKKR